MQNKLTKLGRFTLAAVFSSLLGAQVAEAANINTHGSACRNYNAREAIDIDYVLSGVRNLNAASRSVICPVARSPLAAGATTAGFYVDGTNVSGASTVCTLHSFSDTGTFLGSTSFTTTSANYDVFKSFPAAQASTFAYIALLCTLPPSGRGTLRGVTSIQ